MEVTSPVSNSEKYAFKEFTLEAYATYLERIKEGGYTFAFYHNFDRDTKFCLLRHDVDFSPMRALKMARLEAAKDIYSTYFIQPHCRFYHPLEKKVFDIFKEIKAMGHELALHFDFAFYEGLNEENIGDKLTLEKSFLENFFETEINVFSFHNPNEWAISWGEWEAAGMINTYADYFREQVRYGSDSNGIWRNESFNQIIDLHAERLQLLTHPVWWTEEVSSPKERALSCIEGRAKENLESQLKIWEKWGRDFIDW
ncbi:MAG: hypothetical protein AAF487_06015 [Bacteroidota bacterium]